MDRMRIFAAVAAFTVALVAWAPVASAVNDGQIFLDPSGALFSGCTAPCPVANIDITLTAFDATVTFTAGGLLHDVFIVVGLRYLLPS